MPPGGTFSRSGLLVREGVFSAGGNAFSGILEGWGGGVGRRGVMTGLSGDGFLSL